MSGKPASRLLPACLVLVLGIVGIGLSSCLPKSPDRPTGALKKLVLGAEGVPMTAPVWVAQDQGFFRDEGLDVEIREFESGRTALMTMLKQGGIDIATAAQTPVVANSFERDDYAIIAGMSYSDQDVKLIARADRGIKAASDLRGRSVGITSGSSGHFFLDLYLTRHGMRSADVRLVDLEPARLSGALVKEQVDAVVTWEPHIHRARKALGPRAVVLSGRNIYREDFYFIARKDVIRAQEDSLVQFLRAIERAQAFIHDRPARAVEIVRTRLKMDEETLDAAWSGLSFKLFLDQSILTSLEDEARWAMGAGLARTSHVPNYLGYIHANALRTVRPGAVTLAGMRSGP